MELGIIILNCLILAGMFVLALIAKNYFPRYMSEKAKNLATKEDIASITEQIENVKSNYAHSLEKVKSELQVNITFGATLMTPLRISISTISESPSIKLQ